MSVDFDLYIAVQKHKLEEGFHKLSSLHEQDDDALSDWSLSFERSDVTDLSSTVHFLRQQNISDAMPIPDHIGTFIYITMSFQHKDFEGKQKIILSSDEQVQYLYPANAGLAVLNIEMGAGYNPDSLIHLLERKRLPALFKVLRDLDVVFGFRDCILFKIERKKDIYITAECDVIGHQLANYLGIDKLRTFSRRLYAHWELPGPIFIFAAPWFFHKDRYTPEAVYSDYTHNLLPEETWDERVIYTTHKELEKFADLHSANSIEMFGNRRIALADFLEHSHNS